MKGTFWLLCEETVGRQDQKLGGWLGGEGNKPGIDHVGLAQAACGRSGENWLGSGHNLKVGQAAYSNVLNMP